MSDESSTTGALNILTLHVNLLIAKLHQAEHELAKAKKDRDQFRDELAHQLEAGRGDVGKIDPLAKYKTVALMSDDLSPRYQTLIVEMDQPIDLSGI